MNQLVIVSHIVLPTLEVKRKVADGCASGFSRIPTSSEVGPLCSSLQGAQLPLGLLHTHLVRGGYVMVKPTNKWLGRAYPPRERLIRAIADRRP